MEVYYNTYINGEKREYFVYKMNGSLLWRTTNL